MFPTHRRRTRPGAAVLIGAAGFAAGLAAAHFRKLAFQGVEAAVQGDWLDILKGEHRMVEEIFDSLLQTSNSQTGRRQALLTKLAYALNKHAVQEENVIYPALRKNNAEAAKHLAAGHADMKTVLSRLQYEIPKSSDEWRDEAKTLRDLVVNHARKDEEPLLAQFHDSMSESENHRLSRRMNWESAKAA